MILAFLNMGAAEILVVLIGLILIIALGNYGRNTALGYWGSILLSIIVTPVIAFFIISYLKRK
jgi:ABC-type transport system involved in multi-copper enzyme maturation permease subunit